MINLGSKIRTSIQGASRAMMHCLLANFDLSKIMANMLQVSNLRVMEMAGSSPVALAKSSNSTPFSSAN